ncbi:hypothetical protein CgunFtcFv8_018143 [Champsocephalus gunnari]|uniref:Uncharacterized protein n=1 Tax=Champsocephalus gunnari TaxID=52237 RepID=A0AAN8DNM6_CHAGU|nr:hypothetical protein CgunFtcFv8_018143 [Champsocephalus gunnari]
MGCCVGGVYKCYTRPPRDLLAGWVEGDGCGGAFVLRCILTWWQPQMEVEAAVVMLVCWSLVVMALVKALEPQ